MPRRVGAASVPLMPLPPGSRAPKLWNLIDFALDPVGFFERGHRRYGDFFTVRVPGFPTSVVVGDLASIRAVFQADPENMRAGEANAVLGPLLGAHSLLLLDGKAHLKERRLLMPSFHGESVRRYEQRMVEITERAIERWPVGRPFPVRDSMQAITLEVILRVVFGVTDPARLAALRDIAPRVASVATIVGWPSVLQRDLGPWSPWGRFLRLRAALDEQIYAEIRARRASGEQRDDILSLLLAARHEDGRGMTDVELRDELVTLIAAGHETTATGLAWAFERLIRHPDAMARLVDEVTAGTSGASSGTYLDAVIQETLRVRPVVVDVGRVAKAPFSVGGWDLPAGVMLVLPIVSVQLRADLYPEPKAFRPERFLGGVDRDPYAWIPFGGGTRRCLGASFASTEMRAVLRTVFQRVRLRASVAPDERQRLKHVTLVPGRGGEIVVDSRVAAA